MNSDIQYPAEKVVTVWGAFGIATWADVSSAAQAIAAVLAGLYSLLLIGEWFWKKAWRPLLVKHGILAPIQPKGEDNGD
jgi:hypothetical protein